MASAASKEAPDIPEGLRNRHDVEDKIEKLLPDGLVTSPKEFNKIIRNLEASQLCNLVGATQRIDHIPDYMAISFRLVWIGPGECYKPSWAKGNELAPHGDAVMKLGREAGVQIMPSTRIDDRSDSYLAHYQGKVILRQMNGIDTSYVQDRQIDLRPGSPEVERMVDDKGNPREKQIREARAHIIQVCEKKAQLRSVRSALGLKQSYTAEDFRFPFVIPTLVAHLDLDNPVHSNLAAAHAIGQVEKLYGKQPQLPAPAEREEPRTIVVDRSTGEVVDAVDAEVHDAATANAAAGAPSLGDDAIPPDETTEKTDTPKCGCPCGHGVEVHPQDAETTLKHKGAVRCPKCWPWSLEFDVDAHEKLVTLELKPDITGKAAVAEFEKKKAQKAAR